MDPKTDDAEAATLAAGDYPTSLDGLLPAIYFGQSENDFQAATSTVNYNSLHRHTLSTRTIAHYCRLEQIGEGTYGQVYRAKCLTATLSCPNGGEMVALKKIKLHHPGYWGIPPTVLREIKILKKLQHKNMVKMFEVVSSKGVEDLDWDDEREDEKRKKELKSKNSNDNSTPMPSDNLESLMTGGSKKNELEGKNVATQISSRADSNPKKKKRDAMSDTEKLRESYKGNLFLVLEYISHDLTGLLDMAIKFTETQIKSISKQLLEVLEFMHLRNYVHRDLKVRAHGVVIHHVCSFLSLITYNLCFIIHGLLLYLKTSNVLITDRYEVKLADFGLARSLDSSFIGRVGNNE
jgi:serine/threonine protein kinase